MNFFGIGLPEITVILVLALIVVGPQRLPELAAQLARLVRQARGYAGQLTGQLRHELGDLSQDYEALRQLARPLQAELHSAIADLEATRESVEKAVGKDEQPQETAKPPSEGKG
jgi:sec-independent protein translocase protein TatB